MPNEILVYGDIGTPTDEYGEGITAAQFQSQLAAADKSKPLRIKFHSEGGQVFDGFAMGQAIDNYEGKTIAVIECAAFSIASYLAMKCDEVEIADNGFLMIHNPYSRTEGDDAAHARNGKLLSDLKASMVAAYAAKTGKSEADILTIMQAETYIGAKEAVEMGMANRIIGAKAKAASQFRNSQKLPQKVFASLFGAESGGTKPGSEKGAITMPEPNVPVAATIAEIKAAYPKAKSDFIIQCLERNMPLASVSALAFEEMAADNDKLTACIAKLEEEIVNLKALVGPTEEPPAEPTEAKAVAPVAKAKGVTPIARVASGPSNKPSAKVEWDSLIQAEVAKGRPLNRAVSLVNKQNPGLRSRMVEAANA